MDGWTDGWILRGAPSPTFVTKNSFQMLLLGVCSVSSHGCQSWGVGGPDPKILGRMGRGGIAGWVVGVVDGSWNIIISYYVQEVYSKVTFKEKSKNLPSSCKWAIFDWKIEIVFKLPEKIEIFWKFAWKNWHFSWNCL